MEGAYQVKLSVATLTDDCTDHGNQLFTVSSLGELMLTSIETGLQLKEKALVLYNAMQDDPTKQIGIEDFRMRAPQHDFGALVHDNQPLSDLQIFDEKEFYIHVNQPEKLTMFEPAITDAKQSLHLLTREWDPQTWQFGPLHEFQVPKNMRAKDFGNYLQK